MTIALAVVVPALLWVWAVQPLLGALSDTRAALATERAALARERALAAAAPRGAGVQRAVDSLVASVSARLLDASDDAIAGAQLSTYLIGVARAHRVLLTAAETQSASTSLVGVRSIPVAIRGESDFQGIVDFVRALESGEKLVRVDALTLGRPTDRDASPARAHVVTLRATVVGFGLTPAPRATPVATRPRSVAGEVAP